MSEEYSKNYLEETEDKIEETPKADKKKSYFKLDKIKIGQVFYNPFKKKNKNEEKPSERVLNTEPQDEKYEKQYSISDHESSDDEYSFFNEFTPILKDLKDEEIEEEKKEESSFQIP